MATAGDLILVQNFHLQIEGWEKMLLFLDMILAHLDISIIRIKISSTSTAKAKYPISFKQSGERFLLSLHYNLSNSFLFVNATKIYQLKAKDSEIKDYTQCSGNISKDFTINNIKIT